MLFIPLIRSPEPKTKTALSVRARIINMQCHYKALKISIYTQLSRDTQQLPSNNSGGENALYKRNNNKTPS